MRHLASKLQMMSLPILRFPQDVKKFRLTSQPLFGRREEEKEIPHPLPFFLICINSEALDEAYTTIMFVSWCVGGWVDWLVDQQFFHGYNNSKISERNGPRKN